MRFALLGNHPDGLAFARALAATGRHELAAVYDAPLPDIAPQAQTVSDAMEILADPAIELVIVAGAPAVRDEQLRRAVQSERAVACVHPSGEKADIAYEAALIQGDTKKPLLPLLPDSLHPAVSRLTELLAAELPFRLLTLEHWTTGRGEAESLTLPWTTLRRLAGEIVEVSALAPKEEVEAGEPVLVSGRFEKGGLFQATLLPGASAERRRLFIHGVRSGYELLGPGADGSATLRWQGAGGGWQQQTWGPTDRWRPLVEALEAGASAPSWQDEVRALELDDALHRSVEKRRTNGLEYQEISEEVGSKGTLTLIGCGMIWVILLVFGLSIWFPAIRWAIVPLLLGYLALLGMSWLARKS